MGIAWLVSEVFNQNNRLVWFILYIFISALFILYLWGIHPKIFRSKPTGGKSVLFSLVGFGLGQIYNRQLVKGVIFLVVTLISLGVLTVMENVNENTATGIVVGLILVMAFDAGIGARSARLNVMVMKRKGEVKKKVTQILQYRSEGYELGLDTNFFMHEPDLLVELLSAHQFKIYVSMQVFKELDGLKKSEDPVTRKQAQVAFDVCEAYQKQQRLVLVDIPDHKYLQQAGLHNSPDEKIIGSYLKETKQTGKIIFLSNDKGARIIARNVGMPVADIA